MMDWFLGLVLIAVAGGVGSVIRALLTKIDGWLPYGLFIANSLAAGLVGWLVLSPELGAENYAILGVGLAGGLSTFSTAMKASFDFYHRGRLVQSALTMAGNLFIPIGAMMLATTLP